MPKLYSREGNISLELDLLIDNRIDIEKGRPDSENWIPFSFVLDVEGDIYDLKYVRPCLTIWETKKIINGFTDIFHVMKQNPNRNISKERFQKFEHTCMEVFFDIEVYDADSDILGVIIWINMSYLGHHGFKKGFDFNVTTNEFESFTKYLRLEFNSVLTKYL